MSASIKGQWYIQLNIDGVELEKSEILNILLLEQVGNLLPTMQLNLSVRNSKISDSLLNQTAKIELTLGQDSGDATNYKFVITDVQPHPNAQAIGEYPMTVYCTDSLYTKYLYKSAIKVYDKTSIEAIKAVMKEVDSNINLGFPPSSSDKMKWLQSGVTYKEFIDQLLYHSYGGDNVTYLSAWRLGQFFRVEDIVDLMNNGSSFSTFTELEDTDFNKGIINYFGAEFRTNFGLMNSWLGSGRKQSEINMMDNTIIENKSKPNSGKTNNDTTYTIDKKLAQRVYNSENMHEKYNQAKINNLTNIAFYMASSAKCTFKDRCTTGDTISGYALLDKATILVARTSTKGVENQSNELYSGEYLIGKIARYYEHESYSETFHFFRPGIGQGAQ